MTATLHNIRATRGLTRAALVGVALACAALAPIDAAQAQSRGGHGGHGGGHFAHGGGGGYHGGGHYRGGGPRYGRGGGWGWGGVGLGVGLGLGLGLGSYYGAPVYYDAPDYVVVNPPATVVYNDTQPVPVSASGSQQPVVYPRNGQSAAQIDADSNACSEWAGQQRDATRDSRIFQRGIAACMDARGYMVR